MSRGSPGPGATRPHSARRPEARIGRALAKERAIQESDSKPYLNPEIRENLALLARMYHDHFQTLQESGLEPKSAQKIKLDERRRVFHETAPNRESPTRFPEEP